MATRTVPTGQHAYGVCKELLTAGVPFSAAPASPDVMVSSVWSFSVLQPNADVLDVALEEYGIDPATGAERR